MHSPRRLKRCSRGVADRTHAPRRGHFSALEWRRTGPPRLPIRGDELARDAGIEPGPELGRVLAELREAAYSGEIEDRDDAVELARRLRKNAVS